MENGTRRGLNILKSSLRIRSRIAWRKIEFNITAIGLSGVYFVHSVRAFYISENNSFNIDTAVGGLNISYTVYAI
jgi:hypothetical protein